MLPVRRWPIVAARTSRTWWVLDCRHYFLIYVRCNHYPALFSIHGLSPTKSAKRAASFCPYFLTFCSMSFEFNIWYYCLHVQLFNSKLNKKYVHRIVCIETVATIWRTYSKLNFESNLTVYWNNIVNAYTEVSSFIFYDIMLISLSMDYNKHSMLYEVILVSSILRLFWVTILIC